MVSAMGAHPSSPVKVTDLLLNMVAKAQRQDEAFLLDLAALQVQSSQLRRILNTKCPSRCCSAADVAHRSGARHLPRGSPAC